MRDYWLNRFFFQMQQPDVRERYRADPEGVMAAYRLSDEARKAVVEQDVAFLAQRTNPYLLRFYFGYMGVPDAEFIAKVRASGVSFMSQSNG